MHEGKNMGIMVTLKKPTPERSTPHPSAAISIIFSRSVASATAVRIRRSWNGGLLRFMTNASHPARGPIATTASGKSLCRMAASGRSRWRPIPVMVNCRARNEAKILVRSAMTTAWYPSR